MPFPEEAVVGATKPSIRHFHFFWKCCPHFFFFWIELIFVSNRSFKRLNFLRALSIFLLHLSMTVATATMLAQRDKHRTQSMMVHSTCSCVTVSEFFQKFQYNYSSCVYLWYCTIPEHFSHKITFLWDTYYTNPTHKCSLNLSHWNFFNFEIFSFFRFLPKVFFLVI